MRPAEQQKVLAHDLIFAFMGSGCSVFQKVSLQNDMGNTHIVYTLPQRHSQHCSDSLCEQVQGYEMHFFICYALVHRAAGCHLEGLHYTTYRSIEDRWDVIRHFLPGLPVPITACSMLDTSGASILTSARHSVQLWWRMQAPTNCRERGFAPSLH
jgi:hypothetical protein